MKHGVYRDLDSALPPEDFRAGCTPFSKFTLLTFTTSLISSDLGDAMPRGSWEAHLWCNACSCPLAAPLCKHLIALRIIQRHAGVQPSWHGDEDLLYWGPRAGNWARRVQIREEAPHADPDAALTAVAALPSLTATLAHNVALAATRAREGDEEVPIADMVRRVTCAGQRRLAVGQRARTECSGSLCGCSAPRLPRSARGCRCSYCRHRRRRCRCSCCGRRRASRGACCC